MTCNGLTTATNVKLEGWMEELDKGSQARDKTKQEKGRSETVRRREG